MNSLFSGTCKRFPLSAIVVVLLVTSMWIPVYAEKQATRVATDGIPAKLVAAGKESIRRGADFLLKKQLPDGSWLQSPPMTALCSVALYRCRIKENSKKYMDAAEKGRLFILKHVQKDGSIVKTGSKYVNYSTSLCLWALGVLNNKKDQVVMRNARRLLIGSQLTENNKKYPTAKNNPFYGGIGYGAAGPTRPDLSNTQWALEALYETRHLDSELSGGTKKDLEQSQLAWKNAIQFLKAVQNIPESADSTWVVVANDPNHDGGFIYKPGDSKATSKLVKEGTQPEGSLRAYGSMTYAGLKSMIYAKLPKDDYRVKAAFDWARKHYTLKENPCMGPEGHYYYILTFTKALNAYGDNKVTSADKKDHFWRNDVISQLSGTQKKDGEWYNTNGRWMESIPELVTAYALISLEVALSPELKHIRQGKHDDREGESHRRQRDRAQLRYK